MLGQFCSIFLSLQASGKDACCQSLMMGAGVGQFPRTVRRDLYILHAQRPQSDVQLHAILADKAFFHEVFITQAAGNQGDRLVADAFQITAFLGNQTQPRTHSALDGGETNHIILLYHFDQRSECLRRTHVSIFADDLTQTLLQPCCNQQPTNQFMHICTVAPDDALDHLFHEAGLGVTINHVTNGQFHCCVIVIQRIRNARNQGRCWGKKGFAHVFNHGFRHIACQQIRQRIRLQHITDEIFQQIFDPVSIGNIFDRTVGTLIPTDRIGLGNHSVHGIQQMQPGFSGNKPLITNPGKMLLSILGGFHSLGQCKRQQLLFALMLVALRTITQKRLTILINCFQ